MSVSEDKVSKLCYCSRYN